MKFRGSYRGVVCVGVEVCVEVSLGGGVGVGVGWV